MPVRHGTANASELLTYCKLQVASLSEQLEANTSVVLPSERSLRFYLSCYENYVVGTRRGVCLLWSPTVGGAPEGFALMGEPLGETPFDQTVDPVAYILDLFVQPGSRKHGGASELMEATYQWAHGAGFKTVMFNIAPGGGSEGLAERFSAVPRGVWYTVDTTAARGV